MVEKIVDIGETGLKRGVLSPWEIAFQGVATMGSVGAVGYYMTGIAGIALGSMPFVLLLGLLLWFMSLNANYQMSKHIVGAGGYFYYAARASNKLIGYISGSFYGFSQLIAVGAYGFMQMSIFIFLFFPQIAAYTYLWIPMMLIAALVETVIVYTGVKFSLRYAFITGMIASIFMLLVSLTLIGIAGAKNDVLTFTPYYLHGDYSLLFLGLISAMTLGTGAGSVITLNEEAKNPRKNIRKSIWLLLLVQVLPIILGGYAITILWGPNHMLSFSQSADPAVTVIFNNLGPVIGYFFAALVINANLLLGIGAYNASTRSIYGLSREGLFPKIFRKVHPKYQTPTGAIFLSLVVGVALSIPFGLALGPYDGFFVYSLIITIPIMISHIFINGALPFYTRKDRKILKERKNILFYIIVPIISIVLFAYIIYGAVVPLPSYPYSIAIYGDVVIIILVLITGTLLYMKNKFSGNVKTYDYSELGVEVNTVEEPKI